MRSAAGDAMVASGAATQGLQKPIANPIAIQKVLGFNEKGFKEKPKEQLIPGAAGQQHFVEKSSSNESTLITPSGTTGSGGGDLMPLKLAAGCTCDAGGLVLEPFVRMRAASQIMECTPAAEGESSILVLF